MKKFAFILPFLTICIFLSACGSQGGLPFSPTVTTTPSVTPIPTATVTLTPTQTLTLTPTFTVTSTEAPTYLPYQTKQILFHYYNMGGHSYFELALQDYTFLATDFVLYSDGQMIFPGEGLQKKLSENEMTQFFARLKALGFYTLETDEKGNSTDKLYTPDNPFEKISDAGADCVLTITQGRRRNICAYAPYREYLVPEMKNVLKFLDEYDPKGLTPYSPDRILLEIEPATQDLLSLFPATPIDWPKRFPPLKLRKSNDYNTVLYFQGNMAAEISDFFANTSGDYHLFRQDGDEYFVDIYTVLPHEELNFDAITP